MPESRTFDIVIAGAGPTGLTLAGLLGVTGVKTLVVERNPATSDLPRAIVVDDEALRTFQVFGAAEEIAESALQAEGSVYRRATGEIFATTGRGPREYGFDKRNYIHQPVMERQLLAHVARSECVDIRFGHELTGFSQGGDNVGLEIRSADGADQVKTQYLVGCDGGRSFVRETLGIAMEGTTYAQDWLVLDSVNDPSTEKRSHFICDPARPTVCVPAPDGGRRYEFMLMPGETHDDILRPEKIRELVEPYRPWRDDDIIRAVVYTFHARVAGRWRDGRILLAGDAAHLSPPFAGQGMNSGIRDAHNLAWKLALCVAGNAPGSLLDTYEEERRDPCWAMIELAIIMGEAVMPATPAQVAAQEILIEAMDRYPAIRDYLLHMKFKPKPVYASGWFPLPERPVPPGSLVRAMIPQPDVEADGQHMPLDNLLGSGFSLIVQSASNIKALRRLDESVWAKLQPRPVGLDWNGELAAGGDIVVAKVVDETGALPFLAHRDEILLVRPDRYVAAAFRANEIDQLEAAMVALLNTNA